MAISFEIEVRGEERERRRQDFGSIIGNVINQNFSIEIINKSTEYRIEMTKLDLPPIVFIHGWKASALKSSKGNIVFDYQLSSLLGFGGDVLSLPMEWDDDGFQIKDDLTPIHPCYEVRACCFTLANLYGPMLNHLRSKGRDVIEFVYDWRRELGETSILFEKFLKKVKLEHGQRPQVIAHSMGCLISVHVLNRSPNLFHSILLGAGAISPNISLIEDLSCVGGVNKIALNKNLFHPKQHLSNPGPLHMLIAHPNEREVFGKEETVLVKDSLGKATSIDLQDPSNWKKHKIGIYCNFSQVDVTPEKEAWLKRVLEKCYFFRKGLVPKHPRSEYPPIAVLNSDGFDTKFQLNLLSDGEVDFENIETRKGDGRVVCEDTLPPKGIDVSMTITNKREHSNVLNDLSSVDTLLSHLISAKLTNEKEN